MAVRIAFMGTPEFAVPTLKALHEAGYDIVGVFTQPDRPAGRGKKLTACPAKQCAEALGLNVYQFERLRRPEGVAQLKALAPDLAVTAAFGQILSQELLDIPRHGTLNVHASLLPRHRGAAPINWAIMGGEKQTGVTIMRTDAGLDTGDILTSRTTDIMDLETAGELTERLAVLGATLLVDTIPGYLDGSIAPVKQDEALSSYEPMLKKEMGVIDWRQSAGDIACRVRGLNPWPCACTTLGEGTLKIYLARPIAWEDAAAPGTVVRASAREGLAVRCGTGALEVLEMQAPGGKRMSASAYLSGKRIDVGTRLGGDNADA